MSISSELNRINNEVEQQNLLLEQALVDLQGKAAELSTLYRHSIVCEFAGYSNSSLTGAQYKGWVTFTVYTYTSAELNTRAKLYSALDVLTRMSASGLFQGETVCYVSIDSSTNFRIGMVNSNGVLSSALITFDTTYDEDDGYDIFVDYVSVVK